MTPETCVLEECIRASLREANVTPADIRQRMDKLNPKSQTLNPQIFPRENQGGRTSWHRHCIGRSDRSRSSARRYEDASSAVKGLRQLQHGSP